MMIKDIANKILSPQVIPYIKYDTLTAKHHFFMCIFSQDFDFGINLLNISVGKVVEYLECSDGYVLEKFKKIIFDEIGHYKEVYMIYYFLYHEEGHWLEFLASGLDSKTYCKNIDISGYNGALIDIGKKIKNNPSDKQKLLEEYDWLYRSNPYEQRADTYALKKLKILINEKEHNLV